MCIVTREVKPTDELVRFVLAPDHSVVPDVRCELPGRGVWVSADNRTVETAIAKNVFARGFKCAVRGGGDLVDMVGMLLSRRALGLLSLAQKAGLVRTGFVKVQKLLDERRAAILLHAADGADDGARKITGKAKAARGDEAELPTVRGFTSEELSLALGRANVIHAALTDAKLSNEFYLTARKYEKYWQGGAPAHAVQ
jgi:hypothetical protein